MPTMLPSHFLPLPRRATACIAGVVAAGALAIGFALPVNGAVRDVAVAAVVLSKNKCQFGDAGPTSLPFGSIDPSSPSNATATANIGFRCTGSSATSVYLVTANDGLHAAGGTRQMRHATDTSEFLKYSLDLPQSGSVPRNTNQILVVTGTVLAGDFRNARAGSYSDTVVLTIAP